MSHEGYQMKNGLILVIFLIMAQNAFAELKEVWSGYSAPGIMGHLNVNFNQLPGSGRATGEKKFWSGDYWAFQQGSINLRWNTSEPQGFDLVSPTKEEAMKMTQEELARLSPTEKYDLFTGRYDYPLKKEIEEERADSYAAYWEGICHGWAIAAINHNEPLPKIMTNPDGIQIPFGSSDIKALISYYYAYVFKVANTHQVGRRCDQRGLGRAFSRTCQQDLNAGAFHIILANKLGIEKVGLIAELDPGKEVWNHPIVAFESEFSRKHNPHIFSNAARGTKSIIRVSTTLTYIDEGENTWEPVLGTDKQVTKTEEYLYDIELDAYDRIIGGMWKSKNRPDFLWTTEKALIWVGKFDRLNELMND